MPVLARLESQFLTPLSINGVVEAFTQGTEECFSGAMRAVGSVGKLLNGVSRSLSYYTPSEESRFGSLGTEAPNFLIGCHVPRWRNADGRQTTNVQMGVWDRGGHREVQLASEFLAGAGDDARRVMETISSYISRATKPASAVGSRSSASSPFVHIPPPPPASIASGWHPDPFAEFEFRYWDGGRWTEHVSSDGQQRIDAQ